MKSATHYVVTTNTDGTLNLAGPLARYESTLPKKVVQWGCSGPWVIAWVRSTAPRQELLSDALFAAHVTRQRNGDRPLQRLRRKFGL
jgi:hypothetical protein